MVIPSRIFKGLDIFFFLKPVNLVSNSLLSIPSDYAEWTNMFNTLMKTETMTIKLIKYKKQARVV